MKCVWCNEIATTRDHFIPKWMGGKDLVPACSPCNSERGILAQVYSQLTRIMENNLTYKKRIKVRKWLKKKNWNSLYKLQEKWKSIELSRFNSSPTGEMNIKELVEQSKIKVWIE